MKRSLVSLAVLLLGGASFVEPEADALDPMRRGGASVIEPERDALASKRFAAGQRSAYAVVSVGGDASPYAELEVAGVPWSHGQSYQGLDLHDLRVALGASGATNGRQPSDRRGLLEMDRG